MILNCVRKKFNPQTAIASGIILLLAIPAFIAKVFGVGGGGFNVAKLSGTVKVLVGDAKKVKDAKGTTVKTTRVVRRKKAKAGADDGAGALDPSLMGAGALSASHGPGHNESAEPVNKKDKDEDDDDDGDGGGDGGD